jgi:hypothetical protein
MPKVQEKNSLWNSRFLRPSGLPMVVQGAVLSSVIDIFLEQKKRGNPAQAIISEI